MPGPWPPIPFPTPASWRADRRLRICSFDARGLWIDLLALSHYPPDYLPHIQAHTGTVSLKTLSLLLGTHPERLKRLLDELEELQILDRTVWDHPALPPPRKATSGKEDTEITGKSEPS